MATTAMEKSEEELRKELDAPLRQQREGFDYQVKEVPRGSPKNYDPIINRNKRMLGRVLATLEKFKKKDTQGSEAFMSSRSLSLKRKAREPSEWSKQQKPEQTAENRKCDLKAREPSERSKQQKPEQTAENRKCDLKFKKKDTQGSEAFMSSRSLSLKRKAREPSEWSKQQKPEQTAENRKCDLKAREPSERSKQQKPEQTAENRKCDLKFKKKDTQGSEAFMSSRSLSLKRKAREPSEWSKQQKPEQTAENRKCDLKAREPSERSKQQKPEQTAENRKCDLKFKKKDTPGLEAFMSSRSLSLKRKAREPSERSKQQKPEQTAENRKCDLVHQAHVAAKSEETELERLFLQWCKHHKKLTNFIRTETQPHIYYLPARPLKENAKLKTQMERAFLEWKAARREELSSYLKEIDDQHVAMPKEISKGNNDTSYQEIPD